MSEKIIRKNQIMLRFSDAEFDQVKQLHSSNQFLAAVLRDYILGLPIPEQIIKENQEPKKQERPPHFAPIDPDFLRQVAGAMANLNQLAKLAHIQKNDLDRLHLTGQLASLEVKLNELLKIGYQLSQP